jgi:hypothetical protein
LTNYDIVYWNMVSFVWILTIFIFLDWYAYLLHQLEQCVRNTSSAFHIYHRKIKTLNPIPVTLFFGFIMAHSSFIDMECSIDYFTVHESTHKNDGHHLRQWALIFALIIWLGNVAMEIDVGINIRSLISDSQLSGFVRYINNLRQKTIKFVHLAWKRDVSSAIVP